MSKDRAAGGSGAPEPGAQQRVFYAIWPDAAAARALASLAQRVAADAKGRPTAPSRLHLTVAFVGSVPVVAIDALVAIARSVAARATPFTISLDRVGAFHDAGVAWIGATQPPVPLTRLALDLSGELARADCRIDERPFKAHLTLARRCQRRPRMPDVPPVEWLVDALTLIASELTPQGPRYSELERSVLGVPA